ncbi:hypothetical protein ACVWW6_000257 [Bradyrhizobium sp. USDA 3311]|uniref:hypothetical protein n=1 Tax=unclassified Bradyrhizobium TaxID=2631580 RepID=UPI002303BF67|nr:MULTISPECIES: hypothetical protein [unclassified Bradyrhizobium]
MHRYKFLSTGDPGGAFGPAGKDATNLSPSVILGLNNQSQREYERWQQKAVDVLKDIPRGLGTARRSPCRISMAPRRAVAEHALDTFAESRAKHARDVDYLTRVANLGPTGFLRLSCRAPEPAENYNPIERIRRGAATECVSQGTVVATNRKIYDES